MPGNMTLQADLVLMHAMLPDAPQLLQPIVQYGQRLVCLQQLLKTGVTRTQHASMYAP